MTNRVGRAQRATSESDITVSIDLDGTGKSDISTGLPFFDHMLTAFATHGLFDLQVKATGDVEVDAHHTVEDTAIVLGQALREAVGDKAGIRRFGSQLLPMDEALVEAVVDFSGRAYFVMNGEPEHLQWQIIGGHYATVINRHFFESLATHAAITLHVNVRYGRDPHHVTEAEYKAVARALRAAVDQDPRQTGIPSTKGAL
ncbi:MULTISPECIES: imidazoleglycerol-phosphate dehydratase HisB [unclassified Corynebacterium]|uniref:imidazoleglycerol-phosphate dehydratase HisB n=1 Tax=Corynebacterium TaxID=1716 RepID=UPI0025508F59|nr:MULTISPECIES: imidazoleglycerol-phosphate dehydratase HisB [unclassified Corynebacterium]MDK8466748.1 imidazoleglycerol-phosphate dehydratase HisB [Corynebacterium sp. MSK130]MDK8475099.1 imidazoleglycerol-phosphate dehydratase HisB [Corynebacterium sp. MSK310]MDK8491102.1 imidazoleglycerol-phosphate dehydratase HisB [Corynebacterium sp. MSK175]MDK8646788.1 imidazoleglycerol-phosphate dehydratase HisB [Corynebacterium sp. MSK082]MDK8671681.1 imidazoleglycerol-phosphate dehydratase HisB [Cor